MQHIRSAQGRGGKDGSGQIVYCPDWSALGASVTTSVRQIDSENAPTDSSLPWAAYGCYAAQNSHNTGQCEHDPPAPDSPLALLALTSIDFGLGL